MELTVGNEIKFYQSLLLIETAVLSKNFNISFFLQKKAFFQLSTTKIRFKDRKKNIPAEISEQSSHQALR
jgi:hypothetical protein